MELIYFHKATVHSKEVFLFTSSLGKVLSQAFTWQKACICTVKFAICKFHDFHGHRAQRLLRGTNSSTTHVPLLDIQTLV